MNDFIQALHPRLNDGSDKPFAPVARYYPPMDFLLYLKEDCSFRADRVDDLLTLLWHPYKMELVGLQIKGLKALFQEADFKGTLDDKKFVPLAELIGHIIIEGLGDAILEKYESPRRQQLKEKYREAMTFAANENFSVPSEELRKAA